MALYFSKFKLTRLLNTNLKNCNRWSRAFSDTKDSGTDIETSSSSSSDDEPSQDVPQLQVSSDDTSVAAEKKTEQQLRAEKAKSKLDSILESLKTSPISKADEPSLELSKPEINNIRKLRKEMEVKYTVEPEMRIAVDKVAATMTDATKTRSELLSRLMDLAKDVQKVKSQKSVNDILVGIKIDPNLESRQQDHQKFRPQRAKMGSQVNIYSSKPMHIFTNQKTAPSKVELPTWSLLAKHELAMVGVTTPSTPYEEMIGWTEKGMLWKYPIDNEQGMEQEAKVGFDEHVFLEPHLEEGFPKQGPVREFMELVCLGLSLNPYISVRRKLDHIQWFRNYFAENANLLENVAEA